MKLYLCGPVTGCPDGNKAEFKAAQNALEDVGYEVSNPTDMGLTTETPWEDALKVCITEMLTCDGVATLPSWTCLSKGCRLEAHVAQSVGIEIGYMQDWMRQAQGYPISKASRLVFGTGSHP